MLRRKASSLLIVLSLCTSACGLYTPDKNPFVSDAPVAPKYKFSDAGSYESGLVDHITCEVSKALYETDKQFGLDWLRDGWGTAITLSITYEDQTGVNPGLSLIHPMENVIFPFLTGNVTSSQSFSYNIGGSASVNGLRTETIQYTIQNREAIKYHNCDNIGFGVMIDGDLKINEFVHDKAQIAYAGNGLWDRNHPPYNTWTEEITFVLAYGGTATPTWKLAQISANTSANLLLAQRTNTNDLVVTLGPLDPCQISPIPPEERARCPLGEDKGPLQLTAAAMNQHNTRVAASAIATAISGQTH
jgi:hypothetical protein